MEIVTNQDGTITLTPTPREKRILSFVSHINGPTGFAAMLELWFANREAAMKERSQAALISAYRAADAGTKLQIRMLLAIDPDDPNKL